MKFTTTLLACLGLISTAFAFAEPEIHWKRYAAAHAYLEARDAYLEARDAYPYANFEERDTYPEASFEERDAEPVFKTLVFIAPISPLYPFDSNENLPAGGWPKFRRGCGCGSASKAE